MKKIDKKALIDQLFEKNSKFENSEYLSQNGLYLPTGISLNLKQQNYVIKVLKNIFINNSYYGNQA